MKLHYFLKWKAWFFPFCCTYRLFTSSTRSKIISSVAGQMIGSHVAVSSFMSYCCNSFHVLISTFVTEKLYLPQNNHWNIWTAAAKRKNQFGSFFTDLNSGCECEFSIPVLGSARRGLIFTGIQEGAKPGGLTPADKQSRVFHTMCHHAGFWWGGAGRRELTCGSGAFGGGRWEQLCPFLLFVLCFPLICIIVVPVPFVCCSVKLPLSRPTSFCLFLSILLRTPAWLFCCRPQPNHNIKYGSQACGGDNGRAEQRVLKQLS